MKFLDRILQNLRFRQVERYIPQNCSVLDIGCDNGAFYQKNQSKVANYVGIDSNIKQAVSSDNYTLIKGIFPDDLPPVEDWFDIVVALAVIEHIPPVKQNEFSAVSFACMKHGGMLIITTPSPAVDKILELLARFKLIDGMSMEQHYGFDPKLVPTIFVNSGFFLVKKHKFQFGLNNLFIFQKPLPG